MEHNMYNFESEYRNLLWELLHNKCGMVDKITHSTKGEIKFIPNYNFTFNIKNSIPLLQCKKINHKAAADEFRLWMAGITNNNVYKAYGINYWTPFLKNIEKSSQYVKDQLGPIYGYQWHRHDQLNSLILKLKNNDNSRRLVLYNTDTAQTKHMALPPCVESYQIVKFKGKYDFITKLRSSDVFLGLPFDIYQAFLLFKFLLKQIGKKVSDMGRMHFNLGNAHLYMQHAKQAEKYLDNFWQNYQTIEPIPSKNLKMKLVPSPYKNSNFIYGGMSEQGSYGTTWLMVNYQLIDYKPMPFIKAVLLS